MSNKILVHYDNYSKRGGEDSRATSSPSNSLEFHYTKKAMSEFITADSRVLEIGCGTGYYGMYFADKCREYVGVDLYQPHVDLFNGKIAESGLTNVICQLGDAKNLVEIADNSFDVVCCFGPMYHLPQSERGIVFAECARVCKQGGITAFAYINKLGAYVGACMHDEWRESLPTKEANVSILINHTDEVMTDIFHFSMPEEMEATAAKYGLTKIRNMGTNFSITNTIVDKMDDVKLATYMEIADEMVKYESCTGMSEHALLICGKLQ